MSEGPRTLTPEEARKLLDDGGQLVDVRVQHEWDAGHIDGAVHLPLDDLDDRAGEIDKEQPVAFYCRGDSRSDMAAAAFAADGYEAAALEGGIQTWAEAGFPLAPEGGYVAESGEAASILQARKRA